ncbi:hypothetical protein GGTG_12298 [Gaeumannomyces tritici R3-111a-1]|uniref:BTB domain-containing protein n=1 Tax=Gaeumannomyces tritici (strain R3-111a-1) TaxID=644352 RepID=J3PFM3_GAET3|nr:hypothetical protein GGTG_12298 [Gaeumannomyces tritici R3-111a-1]EJT70125.1 hypothetical protein GGTG_12298 [Gaeumannomyces tritici R3-111a-1]
MAMDDPKMISALEQMLDSRKYTDLAIQSKNSRVEVHRVILCARSPWFDRDAVTNTIHLPDVDMSDLKMVIDFAYTGKYCVLKWLDITPGPVHAMNIHSDIFFLARKLEMRELEVECSKNFRNAAKEVDAEDAEYSFYMLPTLVYSVYGSGDLYKDDKFLKDGLCMFLHNHRGNKELWAELQPLLQEYGNLAVDLLTYDWNRD